MNLLKITKRMILKVERKTFTRLSTIGTLSIDGRIECFTLEDFDRGLTSDMSNEQIVKGKVYGKTCIPYGTYEVAVTFSNHFGQFLPLLMNVPGFGGIRIHPGNTDRDTQGCLLLGTDKTKDRVINSRAAFGRVFEKIRAAMRTEKVYVEIVKFKEGVIV